MADVDQGHLRFQLDGYQLAQAIELVYLSGMGQRRHAVRLDPTDRRTFCGRGVDHVGTETVNARNLSCVPCIKALQLRGVLVKEGK